jgi:hypothetical protein
MKLEELHVSMAHGMVCGMWYVVIIETSIWRINLLSL